MPSLQTVHGRIVDLRRHTNVHLYGRRPLGPTDHYELWIKSPDGAERKFTVNTRHMPARRGHVVSLIVTAHQVPKVLALANWSTIDGVNCARTDAPSLIRTWDFIVLPSAFLATGVRFGDVGMIAFVPAAAMYLAAMVSGRAADRARLAWQVGGSSDRLGGLAHQSHEVDPALIRLAPGMGVNGRRNGLPCRTMIQTATIQFTLEILGVIAGIDELEGAWRTLGTLAPDRLKDDTHVYK